MPSLNHCRLVCVNFCYWISNFFTFYYIRCVSLVAALCRNSTIELLKSKWYTIRSIFAIGAALWSYFESVCSVLAKAYAAEYFYWFNGKTWEHPRIEPASNLGEIDFEISANKTAAFKANLLAKGRRMIVRLQFAFRSFQVTSARVFAIWNEKLLMHYRSLSVGTSE